MLRETPAPPAEREPQRDRITLTFGR
jgi:hypothetical protein